MSDFGYDQLGNRIEVGDTVVSVVSGYLTPYVVYDIKPNERTGILYVKPLSVERRKTTRSGSDVIKAENPNKVTELVNPSAWAGGVIR